MPIQHNKTIHHTKKNTHINILNFRDLNKKGKFL